VPKQLFEKRVSVYLQKYWGKKPHSGVPIDQISSFAAIGVLQKFS
jgi:hypothetical protein